MNVYAAHATASNLLQFTAEVCSRFSIASFVEWHLPVASIHRCAPLTLASLASPRCRHTQHIVCCRVRGASVALLRSRTVPTIMLAPLLPLALRSRSLLSAGLHALHNRAATRVAGFAGSVELTANWRFSDAPRLLVLVQVTLFPSGNHGNNGEFVFQRPRNRTVAVRTRSSCQAHYCTQASSGWSWKRKLLLALSLVVAIFIGGGVAGWHIRGLTVKNSDPSPSPLGGKPPYSVPPRPPRPPLPPGSSAYPPYPPYHLLR